MLSVPANYKTQNDAIAKAPVYVAKIVWNNGNDGTDGINDIYFASCDVNAITLFPYPTTRWFPFLKADSIGSMSQQVDPINGVSSIGSLDVTITDYQHQVSDIIKAADAAGHGLRRQRISIYTLNKGMDWADKVRIRTMQISDLLLSSLNEYKLSAADVQLQMRKTIFNPYSTSLTSAIIGTGAIVPTVVDTRNFIAATSVAYGTVGFIMVDSEIMRWTAKTTGSFTIGAADRGLFGSVAAVHSNGATVNEVIVLNENPLTMALKILESSGVAAANGAWDVYPARWGCNMDNSNDIDEAGILEVGKLLVGLSATPLMSDGLQFEFVISKGVEAKKFIEDTLFKILGCYGFVRGDGKYGIKAYNDLANAAKENATVTLDRNAVVKWGDLTYHYADLANQLWIEYDESVKLTGKYVRNTIFIDSVSIKKWGEAKQLKYSAQGIIPTSGFVSQLYQRFQRVMARYSRPPMQIQLTLLPRYHLIEIGDIVRVTLPIRDLFSGAPLDRAFEVINTQLTAATGEVVIQCIAQPEKASFWFQGVGSIETVTISPGTASIPTGTTQQMVFRAFDSSGTQVPTAAITWLATGNVTVDATGLVTAGATGSGTVYLVAGDKVSNIANFTVTAAANNNPVASVSLVPSAITLKAGDTQQLTALAYDVTGNQVNGVTFSWISGTPATATVPAGNAVSKLLTAVANGTSNLTATETVSGLVSPIARATVATPETPTYAPPALADSAYQIGTKITTMGPVGGPHVIPNGYNFAAGDYWFDGSVSLATATSCTINGTVRVFALGTITISGTVDGAGRGVAGEPAGTVSGYGISATNSGFVGYGGNSGASTDSYYPVTRGIGSVPLYSSTPQLNIIGLSAAPWTSVAGLPTNLIGSQAGGGGASTRDDTRWAGGKGGNSGAGLLLMARGIYITAGYINLNGLAADNGIQSPNNGGVGAGGGGGAGGSLVALAERDVNGLINMSILLTNINTSGGARGLTYAQVTGSNVIISSTVGGTGAVITQIIG